TLVEFGMLASANAEVLTLDTVGVEVLPSTIMSPNNEFLRSILENEFTSFRAYALFSDGTTVYSDNNFAMANSMFYEVDFESGTNSSYIRSGDTNLGVSEGLQWTIATATSTSSGILWNYSS